MIVKLLTEHHLEFLSLKGGCRGSYESTLVKMPHCWKSHVLAQMVVFVMYFISSINSQGHNQYKLQYISLEEVKLVSFQQ